MSDLEFGGSGKFRVRPELLREAIAASIGAEHGVRVDPGDVLLSGFEAMSVQYSVRFGSSVLSADQAEAGRELVAGVAGADHAATLVRLESAAAVARAAGEADALAADRRRVTPDEVVVTGAPCRMAESEFLLDEGPKWLDDEPSDSVDDVTVSAVADAARSAVIADEQQSLLAIRYAEQMRERAK